MDARLIIHASCRQASRPGRLLILLGSVLLIACSEPLQSAEPSLPSLDKAQLDWLGDQIYRNECARRPACLTAWNSGEDFPSMGIGHFIWYRAGQDSPFEETFPGLLRYLEDSGITLPAWIRAQGYQHHWQSRDDFLAALDEPPLSELRDLLLKTLSEQSAFILARFELDSQRLLDAVPEQREALARRLHAVAASHPPYGLYALIDYVHFKGSGLSDRERYAGQGWGLLQVLESMPADNDQTLEAFIEAAAQVLRRRVDNAPPERKEDRWLAGWLNRLQTYRPPLD